MKRSAIITGVVLLTFITAWVAFGQPQNDRTSNRGRERDNFLMFQMLSPEEMAKLREQWPNMSEEERGKFTAQLREKWDNLAEEEKEKLRSRSRTRFDGGRRRILSREDQLSSIKAIEMELEKIKATVSALPEAGSSLQDLSEEERTRLREQSTKAGRERDQAIQAIIAQIAMLQAQRQLRPNTDNEEYVIINIGDLKQVQEMAAKEKAVETSQRIEWLIARAMSTGSTGGRPPGVVPRPQGGNRLPRPRRGPSTTQEDSN